MKPDSSHTWVRLISFCVIVWILCHGLRAAEPLFDSDLSSLTHWEGRRTQPYRDRGAWCVGVGHSLTAHAQPVKPVYTEAEIEAFYQADYADALRIARKGIRDFDTLPAGPRQVVLSVIWQTGATGFMRFRDFRLALSYRAWDAAATELGHSKWFQQTPAARANWALRTLRSQR